MLKPTHSEQVHPPSAKERGSRRTFFRETTPLLLGVALLIYGCTNGNPVPDDPQGGSAKPTGETSTGDGPVGLGIDRRSASDSAILSLPIKNGLTPFASECCNEPGQITECWMEDAVDDGITCSQDDDCPSETCNTNLGVCECTVDDECADGVCTPNGLCGPQWCNGYRRCSCFGGCEVSNPALSPENVCESNGLVCCNGNYPVHPEIRGETFGEIGFCSGNDDCLISNCEIDADCPDDGDVCTVERCDTLTGECVHDADGSSCDDGNACTEDSCDPIDGCTYTVLTGPCDDGNECTENDTCASGTCRGTVAECDDSNPCTDDSCDDATGCVYTNNSDTCDDDDACTVNDTCSAGACSGSPRDCSDGNDCTDESCDSALGCVYSNNTDVCDDGNACTVGDACSDGVCAGGDAADCDDSNPCTDDTCDVFLGCVNVDNAASCDDGNACTAPDVCSDGVCVAGGVVDCDDGNQCTDDTCNTATGCVYTNLTGACDDGSLCTENETCVDGACVGDAVDCDDGNICTDDTCDPLLGCQTAYTTDTVPCDDYNLCTTGERCSDGECGGVIVHWRFEEDDHDGDDGDVKDHAGLYPATSDNEVLVVDGPVGQGIRFGPGNGSNVGNASTGYHPASTVSTLSFWVKFDTVYGEHQTIGSFSGAGKRFYLGIDEDNNIFAGYGNAFVGWSHDSVPSTIEAGVWARMTMTYDGEEAHVYVNGVLLISFEATFVGNGLGPEFFLGTNSGNVAVDEVVMDQNYWPQEDVDLDYDDGDGPDPYRYTINCDDNNPCTDDTCVAAIGCVNTPITGLCDDGNACTENDTCFEGVCTGDDVVCDDGELCTTDSCDPSTGCVFADNILSCDDGDGCTENDTCTGGTCAGTAVVCDDNNPCTDDSCVDGVGCTNIDNTNACDDNNACTSGDACSAGSCTGTVVDCDDGDRCTLDTCTPAGGCANTVIDPCPDCTADADCESQITCSSCTVTTCDGGNCICDPLASGESCDDYSEADYPSNCYHGECDGSGSCVPTIHAAANNLCSDMFSGGSLDTGHIAYMGAIPADGDSLAITGSTLCAENNYYAGGGECDEYLTGNQIGEAGRDLVYAFQYQANTLNQYELYSYILKVEADYDIGVYIRTDISSPSDCPEGNNPDLDGNDETFLEVESRRCFYPYKDDPMPPVVEDECRDNGNEDYGQTCCDQCASSACRNGGYKWCKRGYNYDGSSCDVCDGWGGAGYDPWTYKGNCDDMWVYPEDPFNCASATPAEPGYGDYDYMASAVISPEGATDGSIKTVFVFIDGVDGSQGNFYLTVEKRRWWAGPCDRVNDDGRVYDVTNVGAEGQTFQGTLAGTVNSFHACGGDCGGYGCSCGWTGRSSCHENKDATELWPNQEYFKIHRNSFEGSETYCITTDESIDDSADLVMTVRKRSSDALTICDESYSTAGCEHDNDGDNVQWEFTASPDVLYLLEVSQYERIDRVCTPAEGDDCNYRINVVEGACPIPCTAPSGWYGSVTGTYTVNGSGSGFSPDSLIDGNNNSGSNNYDPWGGWGAKDQLWQIDVSTNSTVRFSGCRDGGTGGFDGQMALFNCAGQRVTTNDNACGSGGMPEITATLSTSNAPYYLLIDGYGSSDKGAYNISMTYQ